MTLTILCFHGCGQDPKTFSSLLGSLQKNLKKHNWSFRKGFYHKREGGWGWYKYRDCDESIEIDPSDYYGIIREIGESIEEPENTVLIGFSEGAQFALDLAQRFTNIRGVVAISPSYAIGIPKMTLISPVVLITSPNDDKVMKKYADKWKKHIKGEVTEIKHFKGHKVYLPLETRQIIKMKLRL